MKRMMAVLAVMIGVVVLPNAANATPVPMTIFSTSFEDGLVPPIQATGNWTTVASSAGAHSGVDRASLSGPTASGGDVLTILFSTAGYEEVELDYYWKINNQLEVGEFFYSEWTPDGGATWLPLSTGHTGPATGWNNDHFMLPDGADNNPLFGVHWLGLLPHSSDTVSLDSASIVAIPEPKSFALMIMMMLGAGLRRRLSIE